MLSAWTQWFAVSPPNWGAGWRVMEKAVWGLQKHFSHYCGDSFSKSRMSSTVCPPSCSWKPVKQFSIPKNLTEILLQAQKVQVNCSMIAWIGKLQHLQVSNRSVFFKTFVVQYVDQASLFMLYMFLLKGWPQQVIELGTWSRVTELSCGRWRRMELSLQRHF